MVIARSIIKWSALLLATVFTTTAVAEVSARLDRTSAIVGETVTLFLETDDSQQSLDVDLSALADDFLELDRRSSSQISIVNGRQSALVQLAITLEPQRAGTLSIPALSIGGAQTLPLTLAVEAAPQAAPGEPEPVFVESQVLPESGPIYVHSQIALLVRLFYLGRPVNATLAEPELELATVQRIKENTYYAERQGQRYQVLERRYAIFPQRSGSLEIPPVWFNGRLATQGRSSWRTPRGGRRISVATEALVLNVEPKPADFPGDTWLPARSMQAQQEISEPNGGVRVGEPVTRTITLTAEGLSDTMLPDLVWPEMNNARVYPDTPDRITRVDSSSTWLTSRSQARYAVVPSEAGELQLPELVIPWWDVTANQLRQTVVPAKTIQVVAAPSSAAATPAAPQAAVAVATLPGETLTRTITRPGYWPWLAGVFAALWLLTLWLWHNAGRRRSRLAAAAADKPESPSERYLLQSLKQACLGNQAQDAASVLRRWSRETALPLSQPGLAGIAAKVENAELKSQLQQLDRHCYGSAQAEEWEGAALWRCFNEWYKDGRKNHRPGAGRQAQLPQLYPQN